VGVQATSYSLSGAPDALREAWPYTVSRHSANPRESAACSTSVKEVVTLLVNSKRVEKRSYRRRLEVRETKYIPREKLTSIALEIDRRELTNRVCRGYICLPSGVLHKPHNFTE
jgi:hypothetical protein